MAVLNMVEMGLDYLERNLMRTTRRTFLSATGAAGLSAVYVDTASAKIEPEPWGIKLGIATYTYRKFERAKAIESIKAVQTPWISIKADQPPTAGANQQLPGLPKPGQPFAADAVAQVRAARADYDAAGLKIMSSGNVTMSGKSVEDLRPTFEWAKAAGLPMMVCAPTHENMPFVEALVKEYNIRIAIHNHGPEDHNFPTPQSVLEVVRKLDARCGLCMDVGHSVRAGADVIKMITEAGPRLFDMHVKDLSAFNAESYKLPNFGQCDVGDGVMPFAQIFKQLKKMNYQGCVNLEYEIHADDPQPGVQRSFSYMRGVLAGLAAT
jgi:sugar phosphate isomerase/epimerase